MKLPRDITGRALAHPDWGYREVNRVGSHMILQADAPAHHQISVPDHHPLRIGTLNAILRSVAEAKGVSRDRIVRSLA